MFFKGLLVCAVLLLPSQLIPQFVSVKGGAYKVGSQGHTRNPARTVKLRSFEISTTEVTNAQFSEFIQATGYVTDAERSGFGMTFHEGMEDWHWTSAPGANWERPFGPSRPGIEGKSEHPVTQISFNDAQAFCNWAGYRLPTVEEWEVAARAGSDSQWPWGNEFSPDGRFYANTWQGENHRFDPKQDGFLYTAPVGQYPPNSWGLYDVIGNVFEYCVDESLRRPDGTLLAAGRGGSWWCSKRTCDFYNLVDIGQMDPRATLPNQGFRVVRQ